jgi:hypothetical protein
MSKNLHLLYTYDQRIADAEETAASIIHKCKLLDCDDLLLETIISQLQQEQEARNIYYEQESNLMKDYYATTLQK